MAGTAFDRYGVDREVQELTLLVSFRQTGNRHCPDGAIRCREDKRAFIVAERFGDLAYGSAFAAVSLVRSCDLRFVASAFCFSFVMILEAVGGSQTQRVVFLGSGACRHECGGDD